MHGRSSRWWLLRTSTSSLSAPRWVCQTNNNKCTDLEGASVHHLCLFLSVYLLIDTICPRKVCPISVHLEQWCASLKPFVYSSLLEPLIRIELSINDLARGVMGAIRMSARRKGKTEREREQGKLLSSLWHKCKSQSLHLLVLKTLINHQLKPIRSTLLNIRLPLFKVFLTQNR